MDDNLYREELMEVYKNPSNKGKITNPTVAVYHKNPACGDEVNLELLVENGVIKDAKFNGSACMVSIVSSSKLTEAIIGKTLAEAKKLSKEELLGLIGLNLTTSRIRCATLSLEAMQTAIQKYETQ